jgi:DNA repair protein RadA/Sms
VTKTRIQFICTECGNDFPRWLGQCPACQEWNTLVEERVVRQPKHAGAAGGPERGRVEVLRLADVLGPDFARWSSGIEEFDHVLGSGVVPGSVVLIGGDPGIGKSTLLLQVAASLVGSGRSCLYVSGEESVTQLRLRADRLREDTSEVHVLAETELEGILLQAAEVEPDLLLVDSIQTVYSVELEGVPGSVGQVRECAARLQRFAKETGTTVFLVGHVTKGGGIAGPKTLEHIVDTVLYFDSAGSADHRVLRATKNRFGGVDEIGVFRMTGAGLVAVENASELFLGERAHGRSGCAVTAVLEGSRPLLVEVQALATRAPYGAPQRVAGGFEHKRLALLLAVLERRGGLAFGQLDVFLNVVGGLRVVETAADAAVVVALASTARDLPVREDTVVLGEVGLGGELRPVAQADRRLGEAARLGFSTAIVPPRSVGSGSAPALHIREATDVRDLLAHALG